MEGNIFIVICFVFLFKDIAGRAGSLADGAQSYRSQSYGVNLERGGIATHDFQ